MRNSGDGDNFQNMNSVGQFFCVEKPKEPIMTTSGCVRVALPLPSRNLCLVFITCFSNYAKWLQPLSNLSCSVQRFFCALNLQDSTQFKSLSQLQIKVTDNNESCIYQLSIHLYFLSCQGLAAIP